VVHHLLSGNVRLPGEKGRVLEEGQRLARRPALRVSLQGPPKVAVEVVDTLARVRPVREVGEQGVQPGRSVLLWRARPPARNVTMGQRGFSLVEATVAGGGESGGRFA